MADIILNFAGLLRKLYSDSPKLVGFFYGYDCEISGINSLSQSGHLCVNRLLESPDIDFFCSPFQYGYRSDEGEFTFNQVMGSFGGSAGLCGKLAFGEDDHRPAGGKGSSNTPLVTRDEWHDEMYFRRNFAQMITQGQHMWWYSLGCEWFKAPERRNIIGNLQKIGIKAREEDCSPTAEVAVVIDDASVSAMRLDPALQKIMLLESCAVCFPVGTPFELYELKSFLKYADYRRFKAVVFLNFFLVNKELEAGMEKLKSDNRTLIFQFAPGYLNETAKGRKFSDVSAGELTGMELREEELQPLIVWIDPERSSIVPDDRDIRYGFSSEKKISPILGVTDKNAEPLGYLYSGTPGFARKKHGNWTSVFSSSPCIPPEVLRVLLRDAGVHIYAESDDVIYANKFMVAFVSSSRGRKQLIMPGNEVITDVFTNEKIRLDENKRTEFFMKRHEVRLFWRRPFKA